MNKTHRDYVLEVVLKTGPCSTHDIIHQLKGTLESDAVCSAIAKSGMIKVDKMKIRGTLCFIYDVSEEWYNSFQADGLYKDRVKNMDIKAIKKRASNNSKSRVKTWFDKDIRDMQSMKWL